MALGSWLLALESWVLGLDILESPTTLESGRSREPMQQHGGGDPAPLHAATLHVLQRVNQIAIFHAERLGRVRGFHGLTVKEELCRLAIETRALAENVHHLFKLGRGLDLEMNGLGRSLWRTRGERGDCEQLLTSVAMRSTCTWPRILTLMCVGSPGALVDSASSFLMMLDMVRLQGRGRCSWGKLDGGDGDAAVCWLWSLLARAPRRVCCSSASRLVCLFCKASPQDVRKRRTG